jgi:hypothetical protein
VKHPKNYQIAMYFKKDGSFCLLINKKEVRLDPWLWYELTGEKYWEPKFLEIKKGVNKVKI